MFYHDKTMAIICLNVKYFNGVIKDITVNPIATLVMGSGLVVVERTLPTVYYITVHMHQHG